VKPTGESFLGAGSVLFYTDALLEAAVCFVRDSALYLVEYSETPLISFVDFSSFLPEQ
jgi:hypothetical protein